MTCFPINCIGSGGDAGGVLICLFFGSEYKELKFLFLYTKDKNNYV